MSGISKSPGSPQIALLGVPIEIGASQRGTLMGPAALRTAGLLTVLEELQEAAAFSSDDFFVYTIGEPIADLDAAPHSGARFTCAQSPK